MNKYEFKWANGSEIVEGKNYKEACSKIKTPIRKIKTGVLVRIKLLTKPKGRIYSPHKSRVWHYWNAEMFWKYLKSKHSHKPQK